MRVNASDWSRTGLQSRAHAPQSDAFFNHLRFEALSSPPLKEAASSLRNLFPHEAPTAHNECFLHSIKGAADVKGRHSRDDCKPSRKKILMRILKWEALWIQAQKAAYAMTQAILFPYIFKLATPRNDAAEDAAKWPLKRARETAEGLADLSQPSSMKFQR